MKKFFNMIILMTIFISMMNISYASGASQLIEKSWDIVDALLWLGYVIALGMVVYIGIKYITGSAEAKSNMKSAIVSYLIGAAFVFSATTIAKLVVNLATSNNDANDLAGSIIDAASSAANSSNSESDK